MLRCGGGGGGGAKEEIGGMGVLGQASIPGPGKHIPVSRLLPHLWVQRPHQEAAARFYPLHPHGHTPGWGRNTQACWQVSQDHPKACRGRAVVAFGRNALFIYKIIPERKILYNNTQSK